MERTGLYSDDFCIYDDQTAAFGKFITNPVQVKNMIPIGDIGVPVSSTNHPKPEMRDVESMLRGLGNTLTRCIPPPPHVSAPDLGAIKTQNIVNGDLTAVYTRERSTTNPVNSIDRTSYNFNPHLHADIQNYDYINFTGTPQRGGLHTSMLIKEAWNSETCSNFLSPSYACGLECSQANGLMGTIPGSSGIGTLPTGKKNTWFSPGNTNTQIIRATPQPLTSQLLKSVGMEYGLTQIADGPTLGSMSATPTTSWNGVVYRGNPYKGIMPR